MDATDVRESIGKPGSYICSKSRFIMLKSHSCLLLHYLAVVKCSQFWFLSTTSVVFIGSPPCVQLCFLCPWLLAELSIQTLYTTQTLSRMSPIIEFKINLNYTIKFCNGKISQNQIWRSSSQIAFGSDILNMLQFSKPSCWVFLLQSIQKRLVFGLVMEVYIQVQVQQLQVISSGPLK